MNKINIYKCETTDYTYLKKGDYDKWYDPTTGTVFGDIITLTGVEFDTDTRWVQLYMDRIGDEQEFGV